MLGIQSVRHTNTPHDPIRNIEALTNTKLDRLKINLNKFVFELFLIILIHI